MKLFLHDKKKVKEILGEDIEKIYIIFEELGYRLTSIQTDNFGQLSFFSLLLPNEDKYILCMTEEILNKKVYLDKDFIKNFNSKMYD